MSETLKLPRLDIQALRGLAVLLVVFYHLKIGAVAGGYLGVDIFFVISGFLITTLVASGIDRGSFRLTDFYVRRAKRLLPAAYVTFGVTAVLAPWFLNQMELRDFAVQIIGAVTFTGNFVLWQQTGYFEGAGDLKPLLHVWSLAIEEQYYFLLPTALLLTRRSLWLPGAIALVLVSLGLCVLGGMWKPIATFYLLPTRAWELLLGSVGALWLMRGDTAARTAIATVVRVLFVPSVACLVLLPFFPLKGTHPGMDASLVCLATLIVILRSSPWLNAARPTKLLAYVGDFSYSLYLVHWPVIAFLKNSWVGSASEPPIVWRISALLLSFGAAYLLYRFVEDPLRRGKLTLSPSVITKTAIASILLVSITPAVMYAMPARVDFEELRKVNFGFGEACEYKTNFSPTAQCQSGKEPDLLIWGDSFAMHLVPGLAQDWNGGGLVQATRSACGPFLGLAPRHLVKPEQGGFYDLAWAESCIGFNQSVIDYLRASSAIKVVVLSSPFSQYVTRENYEHVVQRGTEFVPVPVSIARAVVSLRQTVTEIRAMGKKVVVVAPPPSSDFNIGGCLERQLSGAVAIGGSPHCAIDRNEYLTRRSDVLDFLSAVASAADVSVIRFDPWLCDSTSCKTILDGTMIYRDAGHFSYAGSELMAKRMQFGRLVDEQAR